MMMTDLPEVRARLLHANTRFGTERLSACQRVFDILSEPRPIPGMHRPARARGSWVDVPQYVPARRAYEPVAMVVADMDSSAVRAFLEDIRHLAGTAAFPCIIALLFYLRLLREDPRSSSEPLSAGLAHLSVVLHGARQLFVLDIEAGSYRFAPVYNVGHPSPVSV